MSSQSPTAATPLTASTLSSSSLLTRGAAVVRTRVAEQVTLRDDRIRCCATLLSSSSSALRAKTRRVVRRRRAAPMRRTACTTSSAASQSHGRRHCCRRYSRRRAPSSHTRRRSCCAHAWSPTPAVHTSSPLAPALARRRCDRTDNRTARDSLRKGPPRTRSAATSTRAPLRRDSRRRTHTRLHDGLLFARTGTLTSFVVISRRSSMMVHCSSVVVD